MPRFLNRWFTRYPDPAEGLPSFAQCSQKRAVYRKAQGTGGFGRASAKRALNVPNQPVYLAARCNLFKRDKQIEPATLIGQIAAKRRVVEE